MIPQKALIVGLSLSISKLWKRKKYKNLGSDEKLVYASSGQRIEVQPDDSGTEEENPTIDWDITVEGDGQFTCDCRDRESRTDGRERVQCKNCKANKKLEKKKTKKKLKKVTLYEQHF